MLRPLPRDPFYPFCACIPSFCALLLLVCTCDLQTPATGSASPARARSGSVWELMSLGTPRASVLPEDNARSTGLSMAGGACSVYTYDSLGRVVEGLGTSGWGDDLVLVCPMLSHFSP